MGWNQNLFTVLFDSLSQVKIPDSSESSFNLCCAVGLMLGRRLNLLLFCLRGSEGILLQVRRGEGVHGDARSGYQALEVSLSDPVIPPLIHAWTLTATQGALLTILITQYLDLIKCHK